MMVLVHVVKLDVGLYGCLCSCWSWIPAYRFVPLRLMKSVHTYEIGNHPRSMVSSDRGLVMRGGSRQCTRSSGLCQSNLSATPNGMWEAVLMEELLCSLVPLFDNEKPPSKQKGGRIAMWAGLRFREYLWWYSLVYSFLRVIGYRYIRS